MVRISILAFCAALLAQNTLAQTVEAGKPLFLARCAGCHGEDARGGEHGPNIVAVRQPRASTNEAVLELIHTSPKPECQPSRFPTAKPAPSRTTSCP